jgi:hypothetical protein
MIERYAFGQITVDGQTYTRDVIITPDRVWDGWWREEGHRLSIADLEEALKAQPKVLVVGTGYYDMMQVPSETREKVRKRGIDLHVLPTRRAWKLYNQLASGERKTVAAFHLSC